MSHIPNQPRRTNEEINALMEEWRASGLSKKDFSASKGIKYMTLIDWFGRRQKRSNQNKFIALQVTSTHTGAFAEIHFDNMRKIILHQSVSPEFIRSLLKC